MKKLYTLFICTIFAFLTSSLAQAAVLEVRPSAGGVGTLGDVYPSIQAAIDDANAGDTILIHDGVYDETMDIDGKVDLTLQGESKENTIIKSSSTISWAIPGYPQYDGRMTVVRIYDSNIITIENMTFDCDDMKGNNRFCISGWDSEVTVDNCILKNMSIDDLSEGYYELISYFRAPGYEDSSRAAITFTDNTFIEPGRVGIVTHDYIAVDISGNTFYKTTDDFGYAVEVGSQSIGQVVGNTIYGYDTPAASDGSESAGIYIENCFTGSGFGGSPHVDKAVLVQGNEIYDCQYAMWIGNGYDTYAGDVDITVTLSGNNFHDNVQGGLIIQDEDAADGSSVTVNGSGNTIVDNNEVGLWIFTQGDGDITVALEGETISGNDKGVYVVDYAGGPSGSSYNVAVNGSSISGNGSYGIENAVTAIVVDAESNWWGDATGPYDGSDDTGTGGLYNPSGLGDEVSDYVDYVPWHIVPDMNNLVSIHNIDKDLWYPTLKDAIADADAGNTIVIGEGTYVEDGQIVIDRDLTIKGGSKPTIMTNQDTGTSGDLRGWWLVNDGVELHLQDLILDGSGYNVHQGIRHKGHGTITNVDFKNIVYPPPVYAGLAVVPFGDGPVDITGCTFENIGRVGVLYYGSGVNGSVYSNNTYTGKGPGDWLDYGVEVGGGAQAEIKDSTITDCNGIASVDGSTSAGILVTTYYVGGTVATITGNTLTNNSTGIAVGYDSDDISVVVARRNKLAGNIESGLDNIVDAANVVDAELNWWGDSSGPSGFGHGSGDAVSENVNYAPWYCDEAMTTICGYEYTYARSPSVAKDSSGNYWLAYTVSDIATVLADYNDDLNAWHSAVEYDTYNVYVKKASAIKDLLSATPLKVSNGQPEEGNLQRELGIVELAGIMYIFVSTGNTGGYHVYYYYSSDTDGTNWTGPIEATDLGTGVLHIHTTKANLGDGEKIYVSGAMSANEIRTWTFDGTSFSGPYIESGWGGGTGPRLGRTVAIDNVLYITGAHSGLKSIGVATTTDANTQASYNDVVVGSPTGEVDITIDKLGDQYLLISAPFDSNDTQWLDLYNSDSLAGIWTKTKLTDPDIGTWNYWPELVVEGNNAYVFHVSEDGGAGHIALTYIADCPPGDLSGNCDVDFEDVAILAEDWLVCGSLLGCD